MPTPVSVDVVVFGGGIAGLWTLARLRRAGYSALLFESNGLGGIQSIASQGIIHGGTKYALSGSLSESARAIGDMPALWRACLGGAGELDLSRVRVLSQNQYLWSTERLGSRMTGFFAGKFMRSRMAAVSEAERPSLFQSDLFKGNLYSLDEPVLDAPSLMAELVRQVGDVCYLLPPEKLRFDSENPTCLNFEGAAGEISIQAQRLVLAAGAGNEMLLSQLGRETPPMQRRPLHLLLVKGPLPEIHAHCLGVGANPRLTITSYPLAGGEVVWHLGGQVAESGVQRDRDEQIAAGKAELGALLPWLDLGNLRWAGRRIDRAEIATPGGKRPDSWHVHSERGVLTAWPTKLAFAPRLAAEVLSHLESEGVRPEVREVVPLDLDRPPLACPVWEESEWS